MPWENDNIAEFMAVGRRFTIEKLTYNANSYSRKDEKGNTISDLSDKAYLDSKITSQRIQRLLVALFQIKFISLLIV